MKGLCLGFNLVPRLVVVEMVVCVGTPPFRRIALWVTMETMHLDIARIKKILGTNYLGMTGVPMNNPTPMKTCPGVAR